MRSITTFILSKIIIIMLGGLVLFYFLFKELFIDSNTILPATSILALLFTIILYVLYDSISKIQIELEKIDNQLTNLKRPKLDEKTNFISLEFSEIYYSLNRVLINAKKREADKQKYSAKLKLKNRQRSDMISAIAHEFRNPISAIMGYSQTLQDDKDISYELRDKFLSKIFNNSQKIEDLLSRLILWNKFESGDTKLHIRLFDLIKLINEVKQSLEDKYKNRTILVDIKDCYENKLYMNADRTLMEIVMKNLIENALKYSKNDINIKVEKDYVYVIDSGIGISSEDMSKVTKKFYRSDTHSWDNSMGLGLAIVKTILTLHKINLEIKSSKGVGSCFFFLVSNKV